MAQKCEENDGRETKIIWVKDKKTIPDKCVVEAAAQARFTVTRSKHETVLKLETDKSECVHGKGCHDARVCHTAAPTTRKYGRAEKNKKPIKEEKKKPR